MVNTVIKQGYRLHITTWENDGDDYKTKVFEGLTSYEVNFFLDLAKLFYSANDRRKPGPRFGNEEQNFEDIAHHYKEVVEKHKEHIPTDTANLWLDATKSEDNMIDITYSYLLGYPEGYGYGFYRVFEEAKVEWIKSEINIPNVTSQFI